MAVSLSCLQEYFLCDILVLNLRSQNKLDFDLGSDVCVCVCVCVCVWLCACAPACESLTNENNTPTSKAKIPISRQWVFEDSSGIDLVTHLFV